MFLTASTLPEEYLKFARDPNWKMHTEGKANDYYTVKMRPTDNGRMGVKSKATINAPYSFVVDFLRDLTNLEKFDD